MCWESEVAVVVLEKFAIEEVIVVLTVPLLVRTLCWRRGFRRGEVEMVMEAAFSLITERRRCGWA